MILKKTNHRQVFFFVFTLHQEASSDHLISKHLFLVFSKLFKTFHWGRWCFWPFLEQFFLDTFQSCLNLAWFEKKIGFVHQDRLMKLMFCLGVETSFSSTLLKMFDTRIRKIKVSRRRKGNGWFLCILVSS